MADTIEHDKGFVLTWAGECAAWECDELGHLNMRHYVGKFSQARAFLFIQLGLVNAFKARALSTVRVKDLHIKYLGEARAGQPLKIMSAILSVSEQTIRLCHTMYHTDGKVAATQVETVEHIYLRNNKAFNWPKRLLKNAQNVSATCPDTPPQQAKARNIDIETSHIGQSSEALEACGLAALGAGVMTAPEMDASGMAATEAIFSRMAQTAGWFKQGWPELYDEDYIDAQGSGAVLEVFAVFHNLPRQGGAYHYRAGIISADNYTRTFLHNFNDAVTGECLVSCAVNACLFNLKTRKLVKLSAAQLAVLEPHIKSDLKP